MKVEKDISKLFLSQIGENIKKKRKKKNLSLEELGLEVGLTRMQVHRIEKGYNITAMTILKLSMALGITPGELIRFDYKFKKEDLEKLVNSNKASQSRVKTRN